MGWSDGYIKTEQDKNNYLNYSVKEFKPSSHNIKDLNRMDNWFFGGDFNTNESEVKVISPYSPTPKLNKPISLFKSY